MKRMTMLVSMLLLVGCMAWAADKSFVGVVSDNHCGVKHDTASDAASKCVAKCVTGGGKYVLVSKGKVYQLEPQDKFADHAGHNVKVTGSLEGETLTATNVAMAAAGKKKAEAKKE